MAKVKASNRKYIDKLKLKLKSLPAYVMAHAANHAFEEVVYATSVDSGQARAQWYMVPYKTNYTMIDQEILWGFKDHPPIAPVGYRYSHGQNAQEVADYVLQERTLRVETMASDTWNGVIVYNPITPGFPGFVPNEYIDDSKYKEYAFRHVNFEEISYRAMQYAYQLASTEYDFVKAT